MQFWGVDLEAEEWDRVTNACFISANGDVEHFEGPPESTTTIEHAADFVDKVKGTHYAHFGGIYDTLLITQARDKPWDEVIMSGSAVLTAKAGRHTSIRDSGRWWLTGLKNVGKYLQKLDDERRARWEEWKARRGRVENDVEPERPHAEPGHWLKKDVDRQRMSELTPQERRAYCESDTAILVEGVKAAHAYLDARGAKRANTAGACALAIESALEKPAVALMRTLALDLETAIRASECVRGARVETWALGRVDGVYSYDRKSAYPASYAFQQLPVGARHLGPDDDHNTPMAVWRCRWFWPWRGGESTITDDRARIPPVLDQITGAGAGWCEAWLIDEEIRELEDFVGVRRIEGWAPQTIAPIGQLFVRDLYAEKERGSFFAKVFLNSLHGKMSETPIKESWKSGEKPVDYYGPEPELIGDYWHYLSVSLDRQTQKCPGNVQPVAAAYILGRARIALWRIISKIIAAGYAVYYCDTDSVHTNAPPDVMARILGREYGTGLGELAFEGGPYTCFYVGPKSYCAVNPSTGKVEKGACKGMPWGSLKDGIRERSSMWGNLYRQARNKEAGADLRLEVFEEALREYEGARVLKEGIATWKQGLRMKAGWSRYQQVRTLAPHERGKLFDRKAGPTAYSYQTPAELLIGRGLDLSHDPFTAAENPADTDALDDYSAWS